MHCKCKENAENNYDSYLPIYSKWLQKVSIRKRVIHSRLIQLIKGAMNERLRAKQFKEDTTL